MRNLSIVTWQSKKGTTTQRPFLSTHPHFPKVASRKLSFCALQHFFIPIHKKTKKILAVFRKTPTFASANTK